MYRAGIHALMFCGCVGKNGGGPGALRRSGKAGARRVLGRDRLRQGLDPGLASAERAELALREHRPVALRKVVHRLPHRPAEPARGFAGHRAHDGRAGAAVRNGWLPFYPQFNQNSAGPGARRPRRRKRRGRRASTRRQAEEARAAVLGRGSRRRRELAAGLVHLARQRADVQQQGPRVLPAALPRHARQRDRRRAWPRTR